MKWKKDIYKRITLNLLSVSFWITFNVLSVIVYYYFLILNADILNIYIITLLIMFSATISLIISLLYLEGMRKLIEE